MDRGGNQVIMVSNSLASWGADNTTRRIEDHYQWTLNYSNDQHAQYATRSRSANLNYDDVSLSSSVSLCSSSSLSYCLVGWGATLFAEVGPRNCNCGWSCRGRLACNVCWSSGPNGGCSWNGNWTFEEAPKDDASNWSFCCCGMRLRCNWSICCAP